MYDFTIVALLGLAVWKLVGMILGFLGTDVTSSVKALFTLGLGVIATLTLDYSIFASWGIEVSNADYGVVVTGLMAGTAAYLWHHAIGLLEAYGRKGRDEARAIEKQPPRAA